MAKTITAVLRLKDDFSQSIEAARRATKNFGSEWGRQQKQVQKFSRNVENAGRKMSHALTEPIAKVAKLGGALAALGLTTGFTEALDLQGYRMQLNTAVKDTEKAGKIMESAVQLANRTPFEAGELVQASAMFESMGMSADKWLTATGDMAAATNKDFAQATEALIDAQQGELERLKEFGISKNMIQQKANEMFRNEEIINAKGQIVDQEKFMEALMALMNEKFAGGMEAQSKTIRGIWSTITGVTKSGLSTMLGMMPDGSVRIGSALDVIGDHAQALAETFVRWQSDGTIDKWAAGFDRAFGNVMSVVIPVVTTIKDVAVSFGEWFNGLSQGGQKAVISIGLFAATIGPLAVHVGSFMGSVSGAIPHVLSFAAGFRKLFSAGTALGGVIRVVATFLKGPWGIAITAAIAAGVAIYKNWDKIKQAGVSAFNAIKSAIHSLGEKINWLKNKVLDFLHNSMIGKLASSVGGAISAVSGAIGANAQGTDYWRGGLTTIHEQGGEIIDLERGARVYPHDRSVQMAYQDGQRSSANSINVSFDGAVFHVREEADVDRIAQAIVRRLSLAERNRVPA